MRGSSDRARRLARWVALALATLLACSAPSERTDRGEPSSAAPAAERAAIREVPPLPPSSFPAPARLIAIGDVHGDLAAFRRALRLAGAIDGGDRWIGGELFVVQTGDLLDRGDDEDEILALVARLEREAPEAGGRFLALQGNHEIMNAQGDFRYVTRDGFADFDAFAASAPRAVRARHPRQALGRAAAFAPGGRYARELAARNTVVVVGDTVLVHGGLGARALEGGPEALDDINRGVRRFLLGEAPLSPIVASEDGPVWHRAFATGDDAATCAELGEVLARVGARRMIVGHTVQERGINAACDERVWRIDVGMARHYGGPVEVLEIAGDDARVLRAQDPGAR